MLYTPVLTICLILLTSRSCSTATNCTTTVKFRMNVEFNDMKVTDDVIVSLSDVTTLMDCGRKCYDNSACKSFSYLDQSICDLHSKVFSNEVKKKSSPGWRHYYVTSVPSQESTSCPVNEGYVYKEDQRVCFRIDYSTQDWFTARDICKKSGARLIVLDTEFKNTLVSDIVADTEAKEVYVGLTRSESDDVFVWVNGKKADYVNWSERSSDDSAGQTCVYLYPSTRLWFQSSCTTHREFICEKVL